MSKELVKQWFKAFQERDLSKLKLTDDFVHSSPFGDIEGKETYLALVRENQEAFFSPTLELLDIIGDNAGSAARYLVNGNPACDWFYFEQGMIKRIYSYYHLGETPSL